MLQAETFEPLHSGTLTRGSLVDYLLREQQRTAVERFSEWHACAESPQPAQSRPPQPQPGGQQAGGGLKR